MGKESYREIRLWSNVRQKLPGTPSQGQRCLRSKLPAHEKGKYTLQFDP